MKAIETHYNGYRFRSRLEARWAVFFDHLGIEYQYEPEGFVLSDGTMYLPDFWLPSIRGGCYMEIKGGTPSCDEEQKCAMLANESGHDVLLSAGDIPFPYQSYEEYASSTGGLFQSMRVYFCDGGGDLDYWFTVCTNNECRTVGVEYNGRAAYLGCCEKMRVAHKEYNYSDPLLMAAFVAARSARFEHGETP